MKMMKSWRWLEEMKETAERLTCDVHDRNMLVPVAYWALLDTVEVVEVIPGDKVQLRVTSFLDGVEVFHLVTYRCTVTS
jgi:hypothetical protein